MLRRTEGVKGGEARAVFLQSMGASTVNRYKFQFPSHISQHPPTAGYWLRGCVRLSLGLFCLRLSCFFSFSTRCFSSRLRQWDFLWDCQRICRVLLSFSTARERSERDSISTIRSSAKNIVELWRQWGNGKQNSSKVRKNCEDENKR